jgi:hypothetical protein
MTKAFFGQTLQEFCPSRRLAPDGAQFFFILEKLSIASFFALSCVDIQSHKPGN